MKRGLRYLSYLVLATTIVSCVGNNKVVYLQDENKSGNERYFSEGTFPDMVQTYKLKPGDVLYVNMEKFRVGEEIFNISNFQQMTRLNQVQHPYLLGHTISADSTIDLALIGKVNVGGKTLNEVRDQIAMLAEKQYPGSSVEVFQLDGTVTVLGEVNTPGRYPIYKYENTLFDALGMAGDMKDYADRSTVRIIREEGGEQKIMVVDLNDIQSLQSKGFKLLNDDIVIVSPLKRKKYATANIQWLVSSVTALVAVASLVVSISRIQ